MKPILFSPEMVRAVMAGHKTVTRRVVKPQSRILENPSFGYSAFTPDGYMSVRGWLISENGEKRYGENFIKLPYRPGDILYVGETWQSTGKQYIYKADTGGTVRDDVAYILQGWRPSSHMPKEAARLFLRVTEVQAERLQNITEDQAIKAGASREYIDGDVNISLSAKNAFADIWDSTIQPKDRTLYGWEANPWVWAITFEQISREEAERGATA